MRDRPESLGPDGDGEMPSWFKKVFKGDAAKAHRGFAPPSLRQTGPSPVGHAPTVESPALGQPDTSAYESEKQAEAREVVQAPVLVPEEERSSWSEEIRIKARVESDRTSCVFMVDRPLLEGLSAWFPESAWAEELSPLATAVFGVKGVDSVLLHDTTLTVTSQIYDLNEWEAIAKEVGAVVRDHLKAGSPVVQPIFVESMPPEEEIRQKVQSCVDLEINPGIASHSGVVTLERVIGNTIYITMGGGCQGCAASAITLRQGIHTAFRRSVSQIGAIYDETDHSSGTNPYFTELPAGLA